VRATTSVALATLFFFLAGFNVWSMLTSHYPALASR
jgi:hypothetical protein